MRTEYYMGIDVGSYTTKTVIIDQNQNILGTACERTGFHPGKSADICIKSALRQTDVTMPAITGCISTGYGRDNIRFSDQSITEITCHAMAAGFYYPQYMTVLDIGGQDNKIIHVDDAGRCLDFKMNRKCASGTGVFIEEMAHRLNMSAFELQEMAWASEKEIHIGSFCTVFSATEVLERINQGENIQDLAKAIFRSVVLRTLQMDELNENLVLSGGVAKFFPIIKSIFETCLARPVAVIPDSNLGGALGAALISLQKANGH